MKKHLISFLILNILSTPLQAQMDAYLDIGKFQLDNNTSYLETYLSIIGESVTYKKTTEGYQASINVVLQFSQNNETKYHDKYTLNSPIVKDINQIDFNFIDQQRIALPKGLYTMKLLIEDANNSDDKFHHSQSVELNKQNGFSSIQFIHSYKATTEPNQLSKSGYDLTPFVSNFYNRDNHQLLFYTEFYQENSEKILMQSSIISQETGKIINQLVKSSIKEGKHIPILQNFPIKDLESGSYYILVEAKNQTNQTIASNKRLFYKENDAIKLSEIDLNNTFTTNITDVEQLKTYIYYTYPIQSPRESLFAVNQLKLDSLELMQRFFYKFWKDRDPFQPEDAWNNYLEQVELVNKSFSNGLTPGYKTDRGRVYLQYGSPNSRQQEVLPKVFEPFEVWHYYHIESERNVKFIFMNKNRTNEYRLVLTNKQGEISDMDWLYRFQGEYYNDQDKGLHSPWDFFENPQ